MINQLCNASPTIPATEIDRATTLPEGFDHGVGARLPEQHAQAGYNHCLQVTLETKVPRKRV